MAHSHIHECSLILILGKNPSKLEKYISFWCVCFLFSKWFGKLSLISLKWLLFILVSSFKKSGVVSTTSLSLVPMILSILCQNPKSFLYIIHFQLLFRVSWNDKAYKLDRYHDTKTRMGWDRVKFSDKAPIRGQKVFPMTKSRSVCNIFYLQFVFLETQLLISLE